MDPLGNALLLPLAFQCPFPAWSSQSGRGPVSLAAARIRSPGRKWGARWGNRQLGTSSWCSYLLISRVCELLGPMRGLEWPLVNLNSYSLYHWQWWFILHLTIVLFNYRWLKMSSNLSNKNDDSALDSHQAKWWMEETLKANTHRDPASHPDGTQHAPVISAAVVLWPWWFLRQRLCCSRLGPSSLQEPWLT